jgi:hypothetical protein
LRGLSANEDAKRPLSVKISESMEMYGGRNLKTLIGSKDETRRVFSKNT